MVVHRGLEFQQHEAILAGFDQVRTNHITFPGESAGEKEGIIAPAAVAYSAVTSIPTLGVSHIGVESDRAMA